MYFFISDIFLEYYKNIWSKVYKRIKKELDSEPV